MRTKFLASVVFFVLTSLIGCAPEPESEELGMVEGNLIRGRVVSQSEVAGHLRAAGFAENLIGKMVCVAKWESTFYEEAQNGRHHGLYQISTLHLGSAGCPSTVAGLKIAKQNIQCASAVYKKQGIKAWSAYKAHKTECDSFPAPKGGAPVTDPDPIDTNDDNKVTTGKDTTNNDGTDANNTPGEDCQSATLGTTVEENACVQSKASAVWFQCQDGKWYRGGNATTGPFGACSSSHPLK